MGRRRKQTLIDKISKKLIYNVGTNTSLVIHTCAFIGIFALRFFGVAIEEILLILTTILSIEAVYLAIFIQITVNRTTESLANVEEDIDDIQEDVDDIQEDVDSLETNFKEISEDYIEDSTEEVDVIKVLKDMELRLKDLQKDISTLQKTDRLT